MALNSGAVNTGKSEEERMKSQAQRKRFPFETSLGVVQWVKKQGEDNPSGELRLHSLRQQALSFCRRDVGGCRLGKYQEQSFLVKRFYADIFPTTIYAALCSADLPPHLLPHAGS